MNDRADINPVVIIGVNRNGTTFLANMLLSNFNVTSLHHEKHFGFVESNIYPNYRYFKKHSKLSLREALQNDYLNTDASLLSGLSDSELLSKDYDDFIDFFFCMLEKMASKQGSSNFLIKLDPDCFEGDFYSNAVIQSICERYDNPKFICIQRLSFNKYLNSQVYMDGRVYKGGVGVIRQFLKKLTSTSYYFYFYRNMKEFTKNNGGLVVYFEDILSEKEKVIQIMEEYLGLRYSSNEELSFAKNSSHSTNNNNKFVKADCMKFVLSRCPELGRLVFIIRNSFGSRFQRAVTYKKIKPR